VKARSGGKFISTAAQFVISKARSPTPKHISSSSLSGKTNWSGHYFFFGNLIVLVMIFFFISKQTFLSSVAIHRPCHHAPGSEKKKQSQRKYSRRKKINILL
jgi:hypothetical protein